MTSAKLRKAVESAIKFHNEKEAQKGIIERFLNEIETWWHWRDGRRTKIGGYKIMTLIEDIGPRKWWLGLIRYRKGDFQPVHIDALHKNTKGHLKVNLVVWPAKGANFITMLPHFSLGPLHIFWAQHNPHEVTPVEKGTRYVLSFSLWTKTFKEPDGKKYWTSVHKHQQKMAKKAIGV